MAEDLLRRISPTNRPLAESYFTAKQAQGVAVSTLIGIMGALEKLDRLSKATSFDQITPDQLRAILAEYATGRSEFTARTVTRHWGAFYAWRHDGECPKPIRRALHRKKPKASREIVPISAEEFNAMLGGLERDCVDEAPDRYARRRAILWTLWDSGFRVSELFGLKVSSVRFDPQGAGAWLAIPTDAPDLKTGPRTLYVVECVGALRAWLAVHPLKDDPDAPLFPSLRDPTLRMWPLSLTKMLDAITERSGVRHVHPHLFRHTRATRAAEAGWNEPLMCAFFGWEPGSRMAAHYVHLAQAHADQRVREDAKIDPLGQRIREDPKQAIADAVASTIETLMKKGLLGVGGGRRDGDGDAAAPVASG